MKEGLQPPTQRANISWPKGPEVVIGEQTDFAYIMRKDGAFTIDPIATAYTSSYHVDHEQVRAVMLEEYDTFFAELADLIAWGFSEKGHVELHLYDPHVLDASLRNAAGSKPIISLDPLMSKGVSEFKVSRAYYPGGKEKFAQVARPGSPSLYQQTEEIARDLQGETATIVEDDVFSGGSVISSLEFLKEAGVSVDQSDTGLQIGDPPELRDKGVTLNGVVTYKLAGDGDIFDKVDLGDPRDFLVGASGLVITLPNGEMGRAPYLLPFVSTNARASIPVAKERAFSEIVLMANYQFFDRVEAQLGHPVLLEHMDPHFVKYVYEQHAIPASVPMKQVLTWALENGDQIWDTTEKQGEIMSLELPDRMILLDVNGTLIPDDSIDGSIPERDLLAIQEQVVRLEKLGIKTGLCSDSPLPQLIEYADKLNLDGPIIAENGNVLYNKGKKVTVTEFPNIQELREHIELLADEYGTPREEDCIAQEFGGKVYTDEADCWAFGANRETSITLFGSAQFVQHIANKLSERNDISIDCNPDYPNSLAVHEADYKQAKARTLTLLARYGYSTLLIGNSNSDWVEDSGTIRTAFVGNANVSDDRKAAAVLIAVGTYAEGVAEILQKVSESYE